VTKRSHVKWGILSNSARPVRHRHMAYDEDLANRIREQLADETAITEMKMFGGLAFLMRGNMCVGVSGQGGLMVRVDPDSTDEALAQPHARPFEMRGRPMRGWIRVATEGVESDEQLAAWVRRGKAFAGRLPPK
jgi:TfoX/Sxy family transcriptional regulator of competence genes